MPEAPKNLRDFSSLVEIVAQLRGPNGCPWDKSQNLKTLTPYAIEEAHEYAQAVEEGSNIEIAQELGDLLLQVVLNSQVAQDEERFELADVIEGISTKMVRRHPHVFSNQKMSSPEEVKKNWDEIKASEKKSQGVQPPTDRFDVPSALPALQRAAKIGAKTKKENFDWPDIKGVIEKVDEELEEFREALAANDQEACRHELGDLLFSVAQAARHLGLDPEECLRSTNTRFEKRFFGMKNLTTKDFKSLPDAEKEKLWSLSKSKNG